MTVAIVLQNKFAVLLSAIRHKPRVHMTVPSDTCPTLVSLAVQSGHRDAASLRRFQLRSNRKRRKRIFGLIRTSRSHPADVSQRSPRPSMSCFPPETNKSSLGDGRSQSCGSVCLASSEPSDGQITDTWPSDGIPSSGGAHLRGFFRLSVELLFESSRHSTSVLFAFPLREISSHNGEGKLRSDFLRGPDRHPLAASGRVPQVCLRAGVLAMPPPDALCLRSRHLVRALCDRGIGDEGPGPLLASPPPHGQGDQCKKFSITGVRPQGCERQRLEQDQVNAGKNCLVLQTRVCFS